MDKRKLNGGARKGAGRKPKEINLKLTEKMENVLSDDELISIMAEKIRVDKDVSTMKLWVSYKHGMPVQQTDITTNGQDLNTSVTPISFVTTDND